MLPTVGRIVHYIGAGDDGGVRAYAAIITDVRPDGAHVDLCVFRSHPEVVLGCPKAQRGEPLTAIVGSWDWPARLPETP